MKEQPNTDAAGSALSSTVLLGDSGPSTRAGVIAKIQRELNALDAERQELEGLMEEMPENMSGDFYARIYRSLLGSK